MIYVYETPKVDRYILFLNIIKNDKFVNISEILINGEIGCKYYDGYKYTKSYIKNTLGYKNIDEFIIEYPNNVILYNIEEIIYDNMNNRNLYIDFEYDFENIRLELICKDDLYIFTENEINSLFEYINKHKINLNKDILDIIEISKKIKVIKLI